MPIFRKEPYRDWDSPLSEIDRRLGDDAIRKHKKGTELEGLGPRVRMNAFETEQYIVVQAELPGVRVEDLEVNITGNALSIEGWFKSDEHEGQERFHFQEIEYGEFHRAITLPNYVDTEACEASLENGVLKIKIPKRKESKTKKITIKRS